MCVRQKAVQSVGVDPRGEACSLNQVAVPISVAIYPVHCLLPNQGTEDEVLVPQFLH